MKTAQPVRPDDRMLLARSLCSWSGSDRQAIEIPNHAQSAHIVQSYVKTFAASHALVASPPPRKGKI